MVAWAEPVAQWGDRKMNLERSMSARVLATDAPAATILIRLSVGLVFLSEGAQKFLFASERGAGRFAKIGLPVPEILAPFESGERGSGDVSRWTGDKDLSWVGLRPELVLEIAYDQVSDGRIRHGAKLVAWRSDKPAAECTIDQLDQ